MITRALRVFASASPIVFVVFAGCGLAQEAREPEASDPEYNFEVLWETFDRNYGIFGPKRVDWDALYRVYRPLVTRETTEDELFEIMSHLLGHLNDNHVRLVAGERQFRSGILWELGGEGYAEQEMRDFSISLVQREYLVTDLEARGIFRYAWLPDSIGYLRIRGFSNLAQSSEAIDHIMGVFQSARAMVVDLRVTPGGDDRVGKAIADRFADTKRLYMKTYERNGPEHDDFAPPKYWYVEPGGALQFTGPVVVLMNRWAISAAENFALAMRVLPHVTLVGNFTSGVYADVYGDRLPNGWQFSVSFKLFVDHTGFCWEGIGVPPDLRIINTPDDIEAGRDRVLEFGLDLIRRGEPAPKDVSGSRADLRDSWAWLLERELEGRAGEAAAVEAAIARAKERRAADPHGYYVDEDELLGLVERLYTSDRAEAAIRVLELAAAEFPASARSWQSLGEIYLRLGDEARARAAYAEMLARNRRSYPWERQAAEVAEAVVAGRKILVPALERAGSEAEFAAVLGAFRADPDAYYVNEGAVNSLGYRLLGAGQLEQAIDVFLINTEQFPSSANVWDSLGDGYRAKGDTAQAIASYQKALEIDPNFAASRQNLAELQRRR